MKAIYKFLRAASKPLLGRGWGGLLFYLVLCAMVASCVNDLPYDAKIGAPRLVLNALLQPDSALSATVGRTVHFLDTEDPQRLPDATVTAMVNDVAYGLAYDDSTQSYRSDYILRAGDVVTLVATHRIGTATATAQVMRPVPIAISQLAVQPFTSPGDPVSLSTLNDVDSAMLVSLYIDDPADEANYYRLTVDYYGTYLARYPEGLYGGESADTTSLDGGYYTSVERFYPHYLLTESSSRLIIESESTSQLLGNLLYLSSENSIIFSDERLRGTGAPIVDFLLLRELPRSSASMYNPESGWMGDIYNDFIFPSDTVSRGTYHYEFSLETLSEDYYRYLSTVSTYEGIGNMVSEPVRIHSNVSTAVGIVGSYSQTAFKDSLFAKF